MHAQSKKLFCLDSAVGAKLYVKAGGVATAFYCGRWCQSTRKYIPLAMAMPWLEIVPVTIS
jgi:hypothetical protein